MVNELPEQALALEEAGLEALGEVGGGNTRELGQEGQEGWVVGVHFPFLSLGWCVVGVRGWGGREKGVGVSGLGGETRARAYVRVCGASRRPAFGPTPGERKGPGDMHFPPRPPRARHAHALPTRPTTWPPVFPALGQGLRGVVPMDWVCP